MGTSFFADETLSAAPTNDDLTDATIDQTFKRTATSTEGDRDGNHRRRGAARIIATTKIADRSPRGVTHPTKPSATPATTANKHMRHHFISKYSGASR